VMHLRLAVLEATGESPIATVNASRLNLPPFVVMVQECFRLMGAKDADAKGVINDLNDRRRVRTGVCPVGAVPCGDGSISWVISWAEAVPDGNSTCGA
jgi:hypothetical protein